MVQSEGIRTFLRIRPPVAKHSSALARVRDSAQAACDYEVEHRVEGSSLRLHLPRRSGGEVINNSTEDYFFKFRRVFEPAATQEDVFNVVAKDCVESVLTGYNSTIFAYGQTGSGKTYSITGGTESYAERGIIPRAIAMLYDEIARRTESSWTISIAYLQIYNDKGQDLLNHGHDARRLEDLPCVTIHDGEDEVVLRGLEQHVAASVGDALNLLFLGDTNRLYCETPMNKTSSRSHCIFTVFVEARTAGTSVVRRSKLNLVDLAGSERVSKTGVSGTILTEAKYINLSLHYLEHVITALAEHAKGRRDHVPYRNSFMTMALRDSLGGNCRTSMLATAHLGLDMLAETISTCQFAQRVALIQQRAAVNEVTDPLLLVRQLKAQVAQLKDQVAFYESGSGGRGADRELSSDEKMFCGAMIDSFVGDPNPDARIEGFDGDLARIYFCFSLLRQRLRAGGGGDDLSRSRETLPPQQQREDIEAYRAQVEAMESVLQQKENEVNALLVIAAAAGPRARLNATTQTAVAGDGGEDTEIIAEGRQRDAAHPQPGHSGVTSTSTKSPAAEAHKPPPAALLAHVTNLQQAGRLNASEAAATTEYFLSQQAETTSGYNLAALTDAELLRDRAAAFESFKQSYQHHAEMEKSKAALKQQYDECKAVASELNACVDRIKQCKTVVQRLRAERAMEGSDEVDPRERDALADLSAEKATYNTLATALRHQKESIDAQHAYMKHAQAQLARDFQGWFETRQRQVALALGSAATVLSVPQQQPQQQQQMPPPQQVQASSLQSTPLSMAAAAEGSGSGQAQRDADRGYYNQLAQPQVVSQSRGMDGTPSSAGRALDGSTAVPIELRRYAATSPALNSSGRSTALHDSALTPKLVAPRGSPATEQLLRPPLQAPPRRLEPLANVPTSPAERASPSDERNPFFPQHRSTGNAAADEQLAALYKAREAMRLQFSHK